MNVEFQARELFSKTLLVHGGDATNCYFGNATEWAFKAENLDNGAYGICDFGRKEIIISIHALQHLEWKYIKEIVLHECAHALAGYEFKNGKLYTHGKIWKAWAKFLGAKPIAKQRFPMPNHLLQQKKYAIVYINNGDIQFVTGRDRKDNRISCCYINHDKDTLGKIYHVDSDIYQSGDKERIIKHAFQ